MDRLIFVEGVQKGQRYPLDKPTLTLGRERKNDIPIDDPGSSRSHAILCRTDRGLILRDQGSTNGTFVNSRTVTEAVLQSGDRIAIGDTVILVELGQSSIAPKVVVSDALHDSSTDITLQLDSTGTFVSPFPEEGEDKSLLDLSQCIFVFSTTIAGILEEGKLLPLAAEEIGQMLKADRGAILCVDKARELIPKAIWPDGAKDLVISRTITETVMESRNAVLSNPETNDAFRKGVSVSARNVGSILCVPLLANDRTLGVAYFETKLSSLPFREQHLRLLSALAMELAFAIENANLYKSLRNAEEFASCILKSMPAGMLVMDQKGMVIRVNEMAEEILHQPQKELLGMPVAALRGLQEMADVVNQTHASGLPVDQTEIHMTIEGQPVSLGVSTTVLEDYAGTASGVVCIFRDLSRIRKLEEEIKRSQRLAALGEMAAGIAHEVRNPLNSMRGFAQLLGEGAERRADEAECEYAHIIIEEVDRVNRIVQDMLDFARQREVTMNLLNLQDVLENVVYAMRAQYEDADVDLSLHTPEGVEFMLLGNMDKLIQLFSNLVLNALHACAPGGRVRILLGEGKDRTGVVPLAQIVIQDDGCGIPEDELDKIFNPFYTTKDIGTGLGLPICQKIAEAHAGSILVESQPGLGTTVTVSLPMKECNRLEE